MLENIAGNRVADRNQLHSCSTLGIYSAKHTSTFSKRLWPLWEQMHFSKVTPRVTATRRSVWEDQMSWCAPHANQTGGWATFSPLSPPATSTSSVVSSVALIIMCTFFPHCLCYYTGSKCWLFIWHSLMLVKGNDSSKFIELRRVKKRWQRLNLTSYLCVTGTIRNTFDLATASVRYWLLLGASKEQSSHFTTL